MTGTVPIPSKSPAYRREQTARSQIADEDGSPAPGSRGRFERTPPGSARGHGVGEGWTSREPVALGGGAAWDTGGPCTGAVHARVHGPRGRASALALWRIVVVLDAHQRGMRSTYLTAAFCKPPSSGVPDRAVTLLHGLCPTHRPQAVTAIVRNAYLRTRPRRHRLQPHDGTP